jgi:hypothetical protein
MVGFIDGKVKNIANLEADVSGSVNSNGLGRLYYTGELDENMLLPTENRGPIVDVSVPDEP